MPLLSWAAVFGTGCPEKLHSVHLGGTENPGGHSNEHVPSSLGSCAVLWCTGWAEVPGYTRNIYPGCKQTLPSANAIDGRLCLPWPWSCVISFGCEKAIIAPDNGKSQRWAGGTGNPISQALQSLPGTVSLSSTQWDYSTKNNPHNKLCI